jgi:hypothetical protein
MTAAVAGAARLTASRHSPGHGQRTRPEGRQRAVAA